eukprot:3041893-Rhodomonas_salina.3
MLLLFGPEIGGATHVHGARREIRREYFDRGGAIGHCDRPELDTATDISGMVLHNGGGGDGQLWGIAIRRAQGTATETRLGSCGGHCDR